MNFLAHIGLTVVGLFVVILIVEAADRYLGIDIKTISMSIFYQFVGASFARLVLGWKP